jgi:hypothetical protein
MLTLVLLSATARVLLAIESKPEVVICPKALEDFRDPKSLRPDYEPTLTDPASWPEVFRRTGTVKFYVATLSPDVGLDLPALVAMAGRGGFQTEFEVGGLRPRTAADFHDQSGEEQAAMEGRLLRRWVEAGGKVNGLTTDHAIMHQMSRNFRDRDEFTKEKIEPGAGGQFEMKALLSELMDYFTSMKEEFPEARFGVIESLGYFHFDGRHGDFAATDPRLPRWDFESFIDDLLAAAKSRGVRIEWFDIDFGYNGAAHDTRSRRSSRLEVGRIRAAADILRKKGLQVGMIYNDDGRIEKDFLPGDPKHRDSKRNRWAFENTLDLWRATHSRVQPDRIVLQSWFDYPEKTGPETEPFSFFHAARELLRLP